MCGRTTLTLDLPFMKEVFTIKHWEKEEYYSRRYNIAPTQTSPILLSNGDRHVKLMRWGLVPSWAGEIPQGSQMINARAETVMEKSSFRRLVPRRRCVVLTDGFYEWKKEGMSKVPHYIHDPDGGILPMAGLWDIWTSPEGDELRSYTIITTEPNSQLESIHNRMPVILQTSDLDLWLRTDEHRPNEAITLLKPYEGQLEIFPVSNFVNSPGNNSPECIQRVRGRY
ncbi:MAG: SOS response-associated peptidase [Candidatus Neomarinimicrobiota bacterium]